LLRRLKFPAVCFLYRNHNPPFFFILDYLIFLHKSFPQVNSALLKNRIRRRWTSDQPDKCRGERPIPTSFEESIRDYHGLIFFSLKAWANPWEAHLVHRNQSFCMIDIGCCIHMDFQIFCPPSGKIQGIEFRDNLCKDGYECHKKPLDMRWIRLSRPQYIILVETGKPLNSFSFRIFAPSVILVSGDTETTLLGH